jgi:Fe-S oxidoreductase/nitrate reductase gamma subunit
MWNVIVTEPHRLTYDLMPPLTALVMYVVLSGFAAAFFYGIYRRFKMYFQGVTLTDFAESRERIQQALVNSFAQRKVMKKPYPGLTHILIYSGIIVLLIGTSLVLLDFDVWQTLFHQQILVGYFYLSYETTLDAFGIFAIAGLLLAISRRAFAKPANLPTSRDDLFILSILIIILITGYIMEGIRIAIDKPPWGSWSFVGYQIAMVLNKLGFNDQPAVYFYRELWWFHAILAFTAIASIPYTKLFHIITSPINALFTDQRPNGQLSTPFDLRQLLATGNFDVKVGAATITDFTWKQRLAFDSCTSCGRCSDVCPASISGTLLSPMHLILKLRNAMSKNSSYLVGSTIDQDELWACTTCRACVNECPVLINHVDSIIDMRRQVVAEGKLDRPKRDLLTNLANSGNAYGLPASDRLKWANNLDVRTVIQQPQFEILYWVGCSGSYDPRNQNVSRAIVKILHAANVKFSVLGTEEKCNCEVARRLGEEGRFQQAALELIEVFKKYNVQVVLTQCPHCFNTFKNEYPEFGSSIEVVHHTRFIANLITSGKLKLRKEVERLITFHDPCYLGRYNEIYNEPRTVLSSLGPVQLIEMHRHRESSFCCGAGGADFWFKVGQKKRINLIRFEEAQKLEPDILATACPFCTSMFEDAATTSSIDCKLQVKDIAELVADLIISS